jgi:hypothetical protein
LARTRQQPLSEVVDEFDRASIVFNRAPNRRCAALRMRMQFSRTRL